MVWEHSQQEQGEIAQPAIDPGPLGGLHDLQEPGQLDGVHLAEPSAPPTSCGVCPRDPTRDVRVRRQQLDEEVAPLRIGEQVAQFLHVEHRDPHPWCPPFWHIRGGLKGDSRTVDGGREGKKWRDAD